jgi:hypothetical protein
MNIRKPNEGAVQRDRGTLKMELLIPIALLGLWVVLQIWVLPKLGVST